MKHESHKDLLFMFLLVVGACIPNSKQPSGVQEHVEQVLSNCADPQSSGTTVTLNIDTSGGPLHIGTKVGAMWETDSNALRGDDTRLQAFAQPLYLSILRYPGGTMSNVFNWSTNGEVNAWFTDNPESVGYDKCTTFAWGFRQREYWRRVLSAKGGSSHAQVRSMAAALGASVAYVYNL